MANDPEVDYYEPEDAEERFRYLQRLRDIEFKPRSEGATTAIRDLVAEQLLSRVEEYLTERCNLAYVAFHHATRLARESEQANEPVDVRVSWRHQVDYMLERWQDAGDAREIVRRPLREMRGEKLKGTRHIDGRILR